MNAKGLKHKDHKRCDFSYRMCARLARFTSIVVCGRYPMTESVPKVLGCVIADYSSQANVENTMNPARPPGFLSTQVNGVFHDHAAGAIQNGMNR